MLLPYKNRTNEQKMIVCKRFLAHRTRIRNILRDQPAWTMGSRITCGILSICNGDFTNEQQLATLTDLSGHGWTETFVEISNRDAGKESATKVYRVSRGNSEPVIAMQDAKHNQLTIDEWNTAHDYLDGDDWATVFEFDTFLPNSTLDDRFEYYTTPDGRERMVSSLEYGIKRIEMQKAAYREDNGDGQLDEDIERMDTYLAVFKTARKYNFIVVFSY